MSFAEAELSSVSLRNWNDGLRLVDPTARREQWNDGIMGFGLRLVDPTVRREYWTGGFRESKRIYCIDFLVILAYFLGRKQKINF